MIKKFIDWVRDVLKEYLAAKHQKRMVKKLNSLQPCWVCQGPLTREKLMTALQQLSVNEQGTLPYPMVLFVKGQASNVLLRGIEFTGYYDLNLELEQVRQGHIGNLFGLPVVTTNYFYHTYTSDTHCPDIAILPTTTEELGIKK